MLISKCNGLDTRLKPNLGLKADKYESITPGIHRHFGNNPPQGVISALLQSSQQKRDTHKTLQNLENKPCLSPYRQEKINLTHPSRQLQMMYYRPPPK